MLTIYRSEASASLRRVPIWLVTSNGTSPATGEAAGQPQICWHPRGTTTVNTSGTLSAVSANAGLYHVELTASEVSALGIFSVHYRSASAIANTVFGKIVNYDSGDSVRFGQFALPNAAAEASGGLLTFGTGSGQLYVSTGSVGIREITYSGVTILGVQRADVGYISGDNVAADNLELAFDGTGYSSALTVQGVTRALNLTTNDDKTGYSLSAAGNQAIAVVSADSVWDEAIADHDALGSFGARFEPSSHSRLQNVAHSTTEIRLGSGETTLDDTYNGMGIAIQYNNGQWVSNVISDYTGSNKSVALRIALPQAPDSTSTYIIYPIFESFGSVPLIAASYSGVTVQGVSNYANISNVTLHAGTHSDATIQGLSNYANISNVTLAAGTHSGATIQGLSNYANISNVTLAAGTHSGATIQGISNYANISNVTLHAGSHSGATIDGVAIISTAGERSIASSWMSTNLGSNRLAQEAIFVLRNRVQISGSTGTVFHPDDSTSAWTFSVTTGTDPLSGIDPGGVA